MTKNKEWTREEVKHNLATSREWAEAALIALHENAGFPEFDEIFSSFAEQLITGERKHLTPRQLEVAQRALSRDYTDRVLTLIHRKAQAANAGKHYTKDVQVYALDETEAVIAASGIHLTLYNDGLAYAEAVIDKQAPDLDHIGWTQDEIRAVRDAIASRAWVRIHARGRS